MTVVAFLGGTLVTGAFVAIAAAYVKTRIIWWMLSIEGKLMGQYEDLKATIAQVGVDLGEAVGRVEAKIAALGDPDPDLSSDIAALQGISQQLDALASDPVPPTPPSPPDAPPTPPPAEGGTTSGGTTSGGGDTPPTDGGTPTNGGSTV